MKSNGRIGIGTNSPCTDVEFYKTYVKFNIPYVSKDIYITSYYPGIPVIRSSADGHGQLGVNNIYWSHIYSNNITYRYNCAKSSDIKYKKNVTSLTNSLEKVLKLKGVKYDLDFSSSDSFVPSEEDILRGEDQFGLIAQDVLEVIPEVVLSDSLGLGIDYILLIPVLIEAIKEQNEKILDLEETIKDKDEKEKSTDLGSTEEKNATNTDINQFDKSFLGQNSPNPFSENTTIKYYLPSSIQKASFYVYDLQGKQIKSITIPEREYGEVTIYGNELQAGIYNYSIIADGQIVGMERMVLTD
ncbi:hypothetical protein ES705_14153 [subsurface metagenome]